MRKNRGMQSRIAKAKQAEIGMARMRKEENSAKIARGIQLDLTQKEL